MLDLVFDINAGFLLKGFGTSPALAISVLELYANIGETGDLLDTRRRQESLRPFLDAQSLRLLAEGIETAADFLASVRKKPEPLRVWISQSAADLCGLGWLINSLKDYDETIAIINAGAYNARHSVGEIKPEAIPALIHTATLLSKTQRARLAGQWKALEAENAPMRIVVNGNSVSVEEDFYDALLSKHIISNGSTSLAPSQIAGLLMRIPDIPGDVWLKRRVEWLQNKEAAQSELSSLNRAER